MTHIKKFELSSRRGRIGDYITITWECDLPESLVLRSDNGYGQTSLPIADSGSTVLPLTDCKHHRIKYTLAGVFAGKKESVTLAVHVADKAKRKKPDCGIGKAQLCREKVQAWWSVTCARTSTWWRFLPRKRKILFAALIALWLGLLWYSIVSPKLNNTHVQVPETEQLSI